MLIIFILSLHFLLISIYGILIEQRISRLQYEYLLFALCLPFVGELCLLIAEAGPLQTSIVYKSPLIVGTRKACTAKSTFALPEITDAITREILLDAIRTKPVGLVDLLKRALTSDDVDVAHIAAANLMRIQRGYVLSIKNIESEYLSMPDDMNLLRQYIETIDLYLNSGLLEGDLLTQMREKKYDLLKIYTARVGRDLQAAKELQQLQILLLKKDCE